jgi:GNAT superfamily N-acetyltransferase
MNELQEKQDDYAPEDEHLLIMGTSTDAQGKGLGSELLRQGIARADAIGKVHAAVTPPPPPPTPTCPFAPRPRPHTDTRTHHYARIHPRTHPPARTLPPTMHVRMHARLLF